MGMYGSLRRFAPDVLERLRHAHEDDDESDAVEELMESLDLDKNWQALDYLINGTLEGSLPPLRWAIYGREGLNAYDGDTRQTLEPDEVRAVAEALAALDLQALAKRYDARRFDELGIYPGFWARDEAQAHFGEELVRLLEEVRAFYREAAARGQAVVAEQA